MPLVSFNVTLLYPIDGGQILKSLRHETGACPGASIIVMHGLGASADDFVPFVEQIDLRSIGAVRFVFPQAPDMAVTINGGYRMPAWYDISLADLTRREDEAGLRASQAAVNQLIEREIVSGVPARRIVVAGFSQGCAMALMTGLRYPQRLAGIVGMSGYMPLAELTAGEQHAANADVPVFLAHGTRDGVVPPSRAEAARDQLLELGHPVEWHSYPMEHSVCPQEVADLNRWLLKILA
jgi:phospholipase/carboxylesterase